MKQVSDQFDNVAEFEELLRAAESNFPLHDEYAQLIDLQTRFLLFDKEMYLSDTMLDKLKKMAG